MSLKSVKGFTGQNTPHSKNTGIAISPLDNYGLEDDGLLEMWMATESNKRRTKI